MQKQKCNVLGVDIYIGIASEVDGFRADTYATKEPETLRWILKYFREGDVLYDLGANIGLYSLFTAKVLGGKCLVYAIEPESQNFASLNNNVYINGLTESIIPCCLAVNDRIRFDILNLHPCGYETWKITGGLVSGPAMHAFGGTTDCKGESFKPVHRQGVMGVSVDSMWDTFHCAFPNHVKIDTDGLELAIVTGMQKTLSDDRLRTILIESSSHDADLDKIFSLILGHGFTIDEELLALSKEQLAGTQFDGYFNAIFYR